MKYVSEEELRKWLITDGCAEGHGYIDEDDFVCMDWEDDICDDFDTIMQVYAQGVESERARYKWTPVSNPPKESGEYLVTALSLNHERYITKRSYALHLCDVDDWDFENNNNAGWYDYDAEVGYYKLDNVLAWMPLPKPYVAQESEDLVVDDDKLALLEKTYADFFKCEGGEGWMEIDGKKYSTDVGYALEGMRIFMEVFKRRLAESEGKYA